MENDVLTLIFFATWSKKVYLMSILFFKSHECCPDEIFDDLSEKFESAAGNPNLLLESESAAGN